MNQLNGVASATWFRRAVFSGVIFSAKLVCAHDIRMTVADPIPDQTAVFDYLSDKATQSYRARIAIGEYVSVGIVVRSDTRIPRFLLRLQSTQDSSEGRIAASAVDLRVVRPWYQAAGAWNSQKRNKTGPPVLVPELLLHDWNLIRVDELRAKNYLRTGTGRGTRYVDITAGALSRESVLHANDVLPVVDADEMQPLDLPARQPVFYWITINVSAKVKPGEHVLRFHAICGGADHCGHVDVPVEVLPFHLQDPGIEYSIYYRGRLSRAGGTISSEYKNAQQLTAEFHDIKRHGVTNPTVYQRFRPKGVMEPVTSADAYRLLLRYLELRYDAGFHSPDIFYLGRVTDAPRAASSLEMLADDVAQIGRIATRYGYSQVYFYGIDEVPGGQLESQRPAWQSVYSAGGKIFVASNGDAIEKMAGLLDVLVLHGRPDARYVARALKVPGGPRLYNYGNPQTGPENPALFRVNYGIRLWQTGFQGAMVYAYQHSFGSIWDDFDHPIYRDHALTYPTVDGVIGTIAWEGLREGIMDVRYLQTLHHQLASCDNTQARDLGLQFLRSVRALEVVHPQKIRDDAIDLLVRLHGECGTAQKEAP